jgi:hypothetical protein
MKNIRIVATVALFAWLFCHPPALHAREASASPSGCVKTLRDLSYVKGGHFRQKLDLYLPDRKCRPRWPAFHSGGQAATDA